jgi:hypothetical protein
MNRKLANLWFRIAPIASGQVWMRCEDGSRVRVIGVGRKIVVYHYYDYRGRLIMSKKDFRSEFRRIQ